MSPGVTLTEDVFSDTTVVTWTEDDPVETTAAIVVPLVVPSDVTLVENDFLGVTLISTE